jgi:hypothetical protein
MSDKQHLGDGVLDNPITEMWHVLCFKNGAWIGYSNFCHPNEAAAIQEEERLRKEFDEDNGWGGRWTAKRYRYVLESK